MQRAQLAEIWSDVLGRPEIKDTDGFFELGGDSVSAMNLMFRVEEKFGLTAEVFEVFDYPTFGQFLERMNNLPAGA